MSDYYALGNLVDDPELSFSNDGKAVCKFRIAANVGKNKDGEQKPAKFSDCVCWGKLAEHVAESLKKGNPAYIKGRIETDNWEYEGKKYFRDKVCCAVVAVPLLYSNVTIESSAAE